MRLLFLLFPLIVVCARALNDDLEFSMPCGTTREFQFQYEFTCIKLGVEIVDPRGARIRIDCVPGETRTVPWTGSLKCFPNCQPDFPLILVPRHIGGNGVGSVTENVFVDITCNFEGVFERPTEVTCDNIKRICHPISGSPCGVEYLNSISYLNAAPRDINTGEVIVFSGCENDEGFVRYLYTEECTECNKRIASVVVPDRGPHGRLGFIFVNKHSAPVDVRCGSGGPNAGGDPHFHTWNSIHHFDYHGKCDLVFLKSPHFSHEQGLEIHVRTDIVDDWSYISHTAIRIGHDVLEISEGGWYAINGVDFGDLSQGLGGHPVEYRQIHKDAHAFKIPLVKADDKRKKNEWILVRTFKFINNLHIQSADPLEFADSTGVSGDFATGAMLGRNGHEMKNAFSYSEAWQVRNGDPKLFVDMEHEPQFPQECQYPKRNPNNLKEARAEMAEEKKLRLVSEKACGQFHGAEFEDCVSDAISLHDPSIAKFGEYEED